MTKLNCTKRTCTMCGIEKPLTAFQKDPKASCGHQSRCQRCKTNITREWRKKNPDKNKAQRHRQRLKRYGLTEGDFDRMVEKSGGRCEICGAQEELHIDHNHQTGRVRGLICQNCNIAIGKSHERIPILQNMIHYLTSRT